MDRIYAATTRLNPTSELKDYLNDYMTFYNSIQRRVFHDIKHGIPDDMGTSKYITYVCSSYGILKRTANSIFRDMKGRIKAYRELKKAELGELDGKISALEGKIRKKEAVVRKLKPSVSAGKAPMEDVRKYRNAKSSLYFSRNKLNRLKQKRDMLERHIREGKVSICFGTKEMFRKQYDLEANGYRSHEGWYNDFVKHRDCGIRFLGSGDEACGNQLLQLRVSGNGFRMELSKDKPFRDGSKRVAMDGIVFPYLSGGIISAMDNRQPVTYCISRKGRKWYLAAMFTMGTDAVTGSAGGVIGIDFNDGFLETAETDRYGNLVHGSRIILENHGEGRKAEAEIKEKLSRLVREARGKGKDIAAENLDFSKKKSKCLSGSGKDYNRMVHRLDYHRYLFWLENLCLKYGVNLKLVNPAYTSVIGKEKYAASRKLSVHRAAALVIARRGQGYTDKRKVAHKRKTIA